MEITSLMEVLRWFRWLPSYFLRRIFTKERLSDLMYVDIRPRGDSARVNLSGAPSYDLWLQIINMSPFDVELDRAELDINFCGIRVKNKHLKKSLIKSGEIFELYISDNIDGSRAEVIQKMVPASNDSSVGIYFVFNCKLHQFVKENVTLNRVNVKYNGMKPVEK